MFGLGKKKKTISVVAPITGNAVPLEQVDDPAFAQKIIGDGLAIEPEQGVMVAPFDGHVIHLIDSHHSLVLGHESGLELLFHIGVNTVSLKGEPFTPHVKTGDKVKQGDVLIEFDMDKIRAAGLPVITPVVVANGDAVAELKTKLGPVKKNETEIMEIVMKK
ncbi:PTS glucose transporter subunit IIA [Paenibacillus dendritiformis]|uniref:PTS system glucose subfamily transporter subunit IIA n=1 Tax=Paenibacillus dendritiformis C454 TaxID=1131935 RepID=H3SAU6_9BACL|nr:PTS glucose transporter subunit IIA [Paenibacillus dendritiformis]EHQ63889.1 PTS system glucose subfamily transporter subunit IIA [Paenibacillus dendritiformis C454]PZM63776.1 PTS glucose transporter subunit IIA [Paenibacillus dendritiformis]CAH8768508.1 PTS glucose transporter subunit IIA [Paenibacillus dendritiformis]